ncbi:helix-hairpin-helix domain-containing protein [Rhodococcus sp. ABRD24]|uniref:helix-hairpin-helix domain-containing protein n=1 Tax=Rhodococcus sp. ABRD24 TaxID=2507582 RepID=UPI00103DC1FC|nr:helix-hairpin-helix domain-containing protein [Rhodococcus sp. ABRD24]QBJ97952.1 helix-hairpin-helix domain-containing protein [Rhodococcus sp. ABRD24]
MAFDDDERAALLALKGVGPTVVRRLEEMGHDSFDALRAVGSDEILDAGAAMTGSTCWRNSPQARAAIDAVLEFARAGREPGGGSKTL